jgi:hypothetical protein
MTMGDETTGDVPAAYRGLLESLETSHHVATCNGPSSRSVSIYRRAADAIRTLASEVERLRLVAWRAANPGIEPCPACGPGTSIDLTGLGGARHAECMTCGTRGPRSSCGRALAAWNALPRRGPGELPAAGRDMREAGR